MLLFCVGIVHTTLSNCIDFWPEYYIENYLILHPMHVVDVRKGVSGQKKNLLQYSSLTPLERECYEGEVQP